MREVAWSTPAARRANWNGWFWCGVAPIVWWISWFCGTLVGYRIGHNTLSGTLVAHFVGCLVLTALAFQTPAGKELIHNSPKGVAYSFLVPIGVGLVCYFNHWFAGGFLAAELLLFAVVCFLTTLSMILGDMPAYD